MLIVGTGLLLAACGGGASPSGVANIGTTTTTISAPTSINAKLDKYGACMRSHGLPTYPNPIVNGNTISQLVQPGPKYAAASAACRSLLPVQLQPPSHSITPAQQVYYLRAVACMQKHGVANFPDPSFANGGVHFTIPPSINPNAPLYVKALATCRKLIPAGLPYSN